MPTGFADDDCDPFDPDESLEEVNEAVRNSADMRDFEIENLLSQVRHRFELLEEFGMENEAVIVFMGDKTHSEGQVFFPDDEDDVIRENLKTANSIMMLMGAALMDNWDGSVPLFRGAIPLPHRDPGPLIRLECTNAWKKITSLQAVNLFVRQNPELRGQEQEVIDTILKVYDEHPENVYYIKALLRELDEHANIDFHKTSVEFIRKYDTKMKEHDSSFQGLFTVQEAIQMTLNRQRNIKAMRAEEDRKDLAEFKEQIGVDVRDIMDLTQLIKLIPRAKDAMVTEIAGFYLWYLALVETCPISDFVLNHVILCLAGNVDPKVSAKAKEILIANGFEPTNRGWVRSQY